MDTFEIWNGSINSYIDQVNIQPIGTSVIGQYGGSTKSGAFANEDGTLYLESDNKWRFAVMMDAHATNESVLLLTSLIESKIKEIISICNNSIELAVPKLQECIITLITANSAMDKAQSIIGETAALFCFEKDGYLWWLSIGDNSLYVLQKEFYELGQYRLNQRVFYQWYGQKNSLALKVPCYATGTLHLRKGEATVILLTDGVLEVDGLPYENDAFLANEFKSTSINLAIENILNNVRNHNGRDSATILAWKTLSTNDVLRPTRI